MRRFAALDPGTSVNSFSLAIGEETHAGFWRPYLLREWRGTPGKPLDLRLREGPEAARLVRDAGIREWATDQYEWANVRAVGQEHGLSTIMDTEELSISFGHARRVHNGERVALARPDDPEVDDLCAQLAEELAQITEKREGGKVKIFLPVQGRRHSDLARAWIRMLWHARAGDTVAPFDANAWERANALFRSSRGYGSDDEGLRIYTATCAPGDDDRDLFKSRRAR